MHSNEAKARANMIRRPLPNDGRTWKRMASIAGVWLMLILILIPIRPVFYSESRVQVPIKNEIYGTIQVKELINRGLAEVWIGSVKEFQRLVPTRESVYTAFLNGEPGSDFSKLGKAYFIHKYYWAFITNRNGLFVYRDTYSYQDYWVESMTSESISFYKNNYNELVGITLFVAVIGGFVGFFTTRWLNRKFSIPHSRALN